MSERVLDSAESQRVIRITEARKVAQGWTDILKNSKQSSGMFSISAPQNDTTSLAVGCLEESLREFGYEIVSHSCVPVGRDKAQNIVLMVSLLVRTADGLPKTIISLT